MPNPIPYSSKEFANRQKYINVVEKAIQQGDGLLNLFSVTGMGKSWLLRHLRYLYQQRDDVPVLFFDCAQLPPQDQQRTILQEFSSQLSEQGIPGPGEASSAQALVSRLEGLPDTHTILFLIDSTERLKVDTDEGRDLAAWLQEELIWTTQQRMRAVSVLAGREPFYWTLYRLREAAHTEELTPFTMDDIRELLNVLRVEQSLARFIYRETHGYPHGVRVLIDAWKHGDLDTLKNRKAAAEIILRDVIRDRLCAELPADKREDLEQILFIASILRRLDAVTLGDFAQRLAAAGERLPKASQDKGFYIEAVLAFKDAQLVRWDADNRTDTVEETVRQILTTNLRVRNPKRYRKWQSLAAEMYKDWMEKYPANFDVWLTEWLYHSGEAQTARASRAKKEEEKKKTVIQVGQFIEQVQKQPQMQWDLASVAENLGVRLSRQEQLLSRVMGEDTFKSVHKTVQDWQRREIG
ncbi:MAG: hypothetical protein DRI52_03225 [Chloroflexi bacterium]|nr:MAG: hypothetical protein DRI52_03225 [Chloroflexota bacterium]